MDPVGAGASALRTKTALSLMEEVHFDVIRGNVSEVKALALGSQSTKGVDADAADVVREDNLQKMLSFAKKYAQSFGTIIAITGAIDLVTDGEKAYVIRNGCQEMSRITGTGCQLSGLISAFLAANPENALEAVAAATCAMGLAGEIGKAHLLEGEGNATYRNRIIDAISLMTGEELEKGAKYEIR